MAHGIKPYGRTQAQQTIFGVQDMGELAARLKSIVTHDRRGNVVWMDDFESGIEKWIHAGLAGGESLEWSSEYARSGDFSAKLTTGATALDDATMMRYLPYPFESQMGFEYSFQRDGNLREIYISIWIDDGNRIYIGALRWFSATETWAWAGAGGAMTDLIPTQPLGAFLTLFHTVKLVCDFVDKRYVRLIADNVLFPLNGLTLWDWGASITPRITIAIDMSTNVNDVTSLYIDDAIVTQNEP